MWDKFLAWFFALLHDLFSKDRGAPQGLLEPQPVSGTTDLQEKVESSGTYDDDINLPELTYQAELEAIGDRIEELGVEITDSGDVEVRAELLREHSRLMLKRMNMREDHNREPTYAESQEEIHK